MLNQVLSFKTAPLRTAALIIALLVIIRAIVLLMTPLNLGPDEAQYWRWSHQLDWGYYSKPPLIAWMISLTTNLFGHAEWAIRLYAPFGHGLAAFFLFVLGKHAYDTRTGVWAATIYMLMPGVSLSSGIISTDGLLLPCWAASLMLLWLQREKANYLNAAFLGFTIGLAFLAKYAALYFLVGIGLVMVLDSPTRRAMISIYGLVTALVFAATILPNILWNAANDFATVGHTADNANWENSTFNPGHLWKFITDQMGVFGPVPFLILVGGLIFIIPNTSKDSLSKDKWLLCFILPALIVIAMQAFVSRAHANWAASAYPAASVLVAALALRANWSLLLRIGLIFNAVIGLLLMILSVNQSLADQLGLSNAFKRARGWEVSVIELDKAAKAINASGIVFDERENWHGMDYYGEELNAPPAHYFWQRHATPHAFAESYAPVPKNTEDVFLIASHRTDFSIRMEADFTNFEPVGRIDIDLGGDRYRTFCLYQASGYDPLERTREYEDKFRGKKMDCPYERDVTTKGYDW